MQPGTIAGIFFSIDRDIPSKFTQQVILAGNYGMQGDRHSQRDADNQLLLVNFDVLKELDLKPGQIFENFTVKGLEVDALSPGTRLAVGETAIVEVTRPCPPCAKMNSIREGLAGKLKDRRGVYARVIRGGQVYLQDRILVVPKEGQSSEALPLVSPPKAE